MHFRWPMALAFIITGLCCGITATRAFCASTSLAPAFAATPAITQGESKLKASIEDLLDDCRVHVTVTRLTTVKHATYAVRLDGALDSQDEIDAVLETLSKLTPAPVAAVKSKLIVRDFDEIQLRRAISRLLNGTDNPPKITVTVARISPHRFAVSLSGQVADQDAIDAALTAIAPLQPLPIAALNHSQLTATSTPKPKPSPVIREYKLSFLRDTLPGVAGSNSSSDIDGIGTDKACDTMATFLSALDDGTVTVKSHENHLVLQGDLVKVQRMRELLALSLDVPSPLVRADIYTIQVNTTPHNRDQAQDKIDEIAAGVQITKDFINGSMLGLGKYLAEPGSLTSKKITGKVRQADGKFADTDLVKAVNDDLALVGFDASPKRPLALNDMLVFLALADRDNLHAALLPTSPANCSPVSLADRLEWSLRDTKSRLNAGLGTNYFVSANEDAASKARHALMLTKLIDRMIAKIEAVRTVNSGTHQEPTYVFDRTAKLCSNASQTGDLQGIVTFLECWHHCKDHYLNQKGTYDQDSLPDALSDASAKTDLLLKNAMDAVTADLQELYYQPLLDWIRDDVRGGTSGHTGIDLVGSTTITVRDRTLAETSGKTERFLKFTPINKLTKDMLTNAVTLSNGTAPSANQLSQWIERNPKDGAVVKDHLGNPVVLTQGQSVEYDKDGKVITNASGDPVITSNPVRGLPSTALGNLSPLQGLLVDAVFNNDVDPVYTKVGTGTSLAIRPFVLPGDGSARVQMNLTSTMDVANPLAGQEAKSGGPIDSIPSHTTTTETTISAFDLQTVSSFGAQTTGPGDYSWRIPVLDEIPVIGPLFHGARSRSTVRQDSIVILNLMILPRSLDLVPYYK